MASGGMNAFSLLEGHDADAEDLLARARARLSAAIIAKAEKRKDSNHLPSSLDHEKPSDSKIQNKKINGAIVNNQRQNNMYVQGRKPNNGLKRSSNYQWRRVEEDEDRWQTVGGRSNGYQNNSNANNIPRREIQNGNENENELTVDFKQPSVVDQNSPENGNASDSKEGPKDETCPKEIEISDSPEEEARKKELEARKKELEARRLERELEAKKMTLKQYEKLVREKRKVLESMKTEERRVALDKDFSSMHIIAKKSEEQTNFNSSVDKEKKTIRSSSSSSSSFKAKKVVLPQPPPRRPRRDNGSRNQPDASPSVANVVILPPPSFEDVQQFPALA